MAKCARRRGFFARERNKRVRYVSTRGEAPTLGFLDAMLAGLARDGGLYAPETLPNITPASDIGARRPLLRRGRGDNRKAVRRRRNLRRRAFRHGERGLRGLSPCGEGADRSTRRQSLPARTFPRPDARLQRLCDAVARPADELRAGDAQCARHYSRRHLGRYRRRGDRGFWRRRTHRHFHPLSARKSLGRAAPADDHRRQARRLRHRHRGGVRRLPGHRQGAVQRSFLPRRVEPLRRQLDQLGAHPGADRLLFHLRCVSRRTRSAKSRSSSPPATLATFSPATTPSAWG